MSSPIASSASVWHTIFNRRMLICIIIGFTSGLPLYTLLNLVPAWLRSEHVSLAMIGFFSLIQFPYVWKFVWAPLMDRFSVGRMGHSRGWMMVSQLCLIALIGGLGFFSPQHDLSSVTILACLVAFVSASQDIVIDAYRRKILSDEELGWGNTLHVNAYKIAGLIPGGVALILADHLPWSQVFLITALCLLPGLILTSVIAEPVLLSPAPKTLRAAVVEPFREFIARYGVMGALQILLFIFLYKLGDSMATALATPFYMDMGFSKTDIGLIAKNVGLWANVLGGVLGGLWMIRLGINRALWIFGIAQMVTILGFAWLSLMPGQSWVLASVIGAEALGVGLGTAAFIAFIARATNPVYTATQFALFTSLAAVPRTFMNALTGFIVTALGWFDFFILCFVLAIPGLCLLFRVAPWREK